MSNGQALRYLSSLENQSALEATTNTIKEVDLVQTSKYKVAKKRPAQAESVTHSSKRKKNKRTEEEEKGVECELCCGSSCAAFPLQCDCASEGGHTVCTACVARWAKNGQQMFNCPFCRKPIENFDGDVPPSAPAWVADDEVLLADDIDDEDECMVCQETGTLLVCEGCGKGCHTYVRK